MTEGLRRILKFISRALLVLLGGIAGYQVSFLWPDGILGQSSSMYLTIGFVVAGAVIGFMIAPLFMFLLNKTSILFEHQLRSISWNEISTAMAGLIVGLMLANLLAIPFFDLPLGPYIAVLLNVLIGYVSAVLFVRRRDDLKNAAQSLKGRFNARSSRNGEREAFAKEKIEALAVPPKVLDTSALIDGRILDVAQAGFLQGVLVVPRVVLGELQGIADSTEMARRNRGRQGLDVVQKLQNCKDLKVHIAEASLQSLNVEAVDEAILVLASRMKAQIVTTDYNLNKVAKIRKLKVLNVNELSNALKPVMMPGEQVTVDVIRRGKDSRQGVGYLENGTMLVVEDGGNQIGQRVTVTVSSTIQTPAGRMVFGRIGKEGHS